MLPYSSAVIVSCLRQEGFNVAHRDLRNLMDIYFGRQLSHRDFDQWLRLGKKTRLMKIYMRRVFDLLPDFKNVQLIGISVFSFINYPHALALAKEIRQRYKDIPMCCGGTFITLKKITPPAYVDFFIRGHGRTPILHLANHFIREQPLKDTVVGLCYMKEKKYIDNGVNQEGAENEEAPDFSDLDKSLYWLSLNEKYNREILAVPYRMSLGCVNKCSFCTGRLVDNLSFKSRDKVIRELRLLSSLVPNTKLYIRFCDTAINNNCEILEESLDILSRDGIRFSWAGFLKFNNIDERLLKKMAQLGCRELIWGLESITPHMIKIYNKKFNPLEAEQYLMVASQLGIINFVYVMYNGPGETSDDIAATENFVNKFLRNNNVTFIFSEFMLEKDTDIFNYPGKYGVQLVGGFYGSKFLQREIVRWKESALDEATFSKKQKIHKIRMQKLKNRVSVAKYFIKKEFTNSFVINLAILLFDWGQQLRNFLVK